MKVTPHTMLMGTTKSNPLQDGYYINNTAYKPKLWDLWQAAGFPNSIGSMLQHPDTIAAGADIVCPTEVCTGAA